MTSITSDEFLRAGRLAVAGNGDVIDAARFGWHALHEITVLQFMQKTAQFFFQQRQIDWRRRAAHKFGHLAVDAAPVAGIVGIQVDADGDSACAARDDRIHIAQSCAVAAVVGSAQF